MVTVEDKHESKMFMPLNWRPNVRVRSLFFPRKPKDVLSEPESNKSTSTVTDGLQSMTAASTSSLTKNQTLTQKPTEQIKSTTTTTDGNNIEMS